MKLTAKLVVTMSALSYVVFIDTRERRRVVRRAGAQARHLQPRLQRAEVRDTGIGIPKEIVEGHGGRIWVESVYQKGTSFLFTLPKQAAATAKEDGGLHDHRVRLLGPG